MQSHVEANDHVALRRITPFFSERKLQFTPYAIKAKSIRCHAGSRFLPLPRLSILYALILFVTVAATQALALSTPPDLHSHEGIRLNKVFKRTHSRRQADALIDAGRVAVNGKPVVNKGGFLVTPFVDKVTLDGKIVEGWEEMNAFSESPSNNSSSDEQNGRIDEEQNEQSIFTEHFEYIKYWKPRGVTCTTDRNDRSNILDALMKDGYKNPRRQRIYPVGRLDKDTNGLILLTSDGRLPNSALRMKNKQPKVYHATVDRKLREADLQTLREGIVITTDVARNGKHRALTQKTLPCEVERVDDYCLCMTLVEGRNRQVRKMTAALNYTTVELLRTAFMGIQLDPLQGPGDWARLSEDEMEIVRSVMAGAVTESDMHRSEQGRMD